MYSEETINKIKEIAIIKEVIEQFVPLKKHGADWIACCPFHSEKTPSFHISPAKGIYKCFGCGKGGNDSIQFLIDKEGLSYIEALKWLGAKYNITLEEEGDKVYILPPWRNQTSLVKEVVQWFENRKISQETLIKCKVTDGPEWMPSLQASTHTIQFNYFRNDQLVNIKYRDDQKGFKLFKDAELIFYNVDSMRGKKEVFITEGCIDTLSLIQAGYWNETSGVISVPNGASKFTNNLTYVNNCIELFKDIEIIHLCLDNDANGRKLRDELADRFGKYRCDFIEFKGSKDANECLMKDGIQGIIDSCSNPILFPLEGAFTISDFENEINDMYENGLEKGVSIKLPEFGLRFVKGYITGVTGIPSHGKSEAVDEITLRLTTKHGWKGAFFSPENKPTQLHFSKMARRLTGKHWEGDNRITPEEMQQVIKYLERKIWFIKPKKDFSLDSVLESILELHILHGLDYFVIDAWNTLEHQGEGKLDYIGKSLTKIANFCEMHNLHCFLVVHPTKIDKDKKTGLDQIPTLYNMSGSADFRNKIDNGICIYRDFTKDISTWYRQKIKFNHWGWFGMSEYKYEPNSGRYFKEGYPETTNWITGLPIQNKLTKEQELEQSQQVIGFDSTNTEEPPF